MPTTTDPFRCAPYIKEVGRGAKGARGLSTDDARTLYAAVLAGRVSDLELGALLLAYRIKGESADELDGMLDAVHGTYTPVAVPAGRRGVCIPTYNGARKLPNLVPLLAFLLAKDGVPVLLHGVRQDPGRVATAEVLACMGVAPSESTADAQGQLAERGVALLPIDVLSPIMAGQLALRATLGVRNSAHTLVKLLQPADPGTLRLVNYTHPPYRDTLSAYFVRPHAAPGAGVLLARGTEGEAVADPSIVRPTEWLREGQTSTCIAPDPEAPRVQAVLPDSREAEPTAAWIQRALAGDVPVPAPILRQRDAILAIVRA